MEKISPVLLTFLVNATWQVAMIAGVASIGARLLRAAPARYRHFLWVAALFLSVTLPLLNLADLLPRRTRTMAATSNAPSQITTQPLDETSYAPVVDVPVTTSAVASPRRDFAIPPRIAVTLVGIYFAFLLFQFAGLFRAWWLARRIVRNSARPEFSAAVQGIVARCLEQTGVRRVRFLFSTSVAAAPLTVGALPAVIVLPEKLLRDYDETLLTSAIGHELVHVQRRDYLLNFLYRLLYIPLSFHPAAALIKRRIDQTRELRCDEVVTDSLLSPAAYARSLVELAGDAHAFRRPATVAVGIADADILEERIMSMLKKPTLSAARRTLLLLTVTLVVALPCIAAAPYALHLNLAAPAAVLPVANAAENPAQAVQSASQDVKPAARSAAFEAGYRAGQSYAARTPGDETQEQSAKAKAERDAQSTAGFVVKSDLGQSQTPEERVAREKQIQEELGKVRWKMEESQMSPEEREAHRQRERLEMAAKSRRMAELTKSAKITMQQAIDIATRQQPGTVMESSLMGERRDVTRRADGAVTEKMFGPAGVIYRIVVLFGDENDLKRAIVFVNAVDGTVIKEEREE